MITERKQLSRRWLWLGAVVVLILVYFAVRSLPLPDKAQEVSSGSIFVVNIIIFTNMAYRAIDEIIHVVAMRHNLMATPFSVLVALTVHCRSTGGGIFGTHCNDMFIHMIVVHVVQMAVVEVVDVLVVADSNVTAVGSMLVVMAGVFVASAHTSYPFRVCLCQSDDG